MPDRHDPPGRPGRLLSAHLDGLRASLSAIGGRLRESVCTAIGHCAAEALRQALAALLRPPNAPDAVRATIDALSRLEDRPRLGDPYRRPGQPRSDWGEPDRLDDWHRAGASRWDRRDSTGWRDDRHDPGDGYDDEPEDDDHDEQGRQPSGGGWRSVLAAGCRLLAWLLGRLAAPGARMLALGAGLATALAVWLAGATPGSGTLTDALAATAGALAGLTGP
jgi:hypothetical protein